MSALFDSPQYLIGPQLYPAFTGLTRWMLPTVLVGAAVVNAAVYLVTEPTPVIGALIPIIPTSFVYAGHLNDGGSFLNPGLWNVWLPIYYGFLVVFAAAEVWKVHAPRLTTAVRLAGLGVPCAFAVFVSAAILTQDIVDPAILDDAAWSRASWLDPALVVVIWMPALWIVEKRRMAPTPV